MYILTVVIICYICAVLYTLHVVPIKCAYAFTAGVCEWIWLKSSRTGTPQAMGHLAFKSANRCGIACVKGAQLFVSGRTYLHPDFVTAFQAVYDNNTPDWGSSKIPDYVSWKLDKVEKIPFAIGSICRVHIGYLGSEKYAVKLVNRYVAFELSQWRAFDRALAYLSFLPLIRQITPFTRNINDQLTMQLDLKREARNYNTFRRNFRQMTEVCFPKPIWVSPQALIMEYLPGTPLQQLSPNLQAEAGLVLFRVLLQMILMDGFVHADIHLGNLAYAKGQLIIYDTGLVVHIDLKTRALVKRMLLSLCNRDETLIAALFKELSTLEVITDDMIARDIRVLMDLVDTENITEVFRTLLDLNTRYQIKRFDALALLLNIMVSGIRIVALLRPSENIFQFISSELALFVLFHS